MIETETETKMKKHTFSVESQHSRVKKRKTMLSPQEIVTKDDELTPLIQYFC
jgi:hypothetical protein